MKNFTSFIGILVLTGMVVSAAVMAADSADVTARVRVQNISVTVSDGFVDYGALPLSGDEDTTSNGINDSQTATNNGNLTEDFNIEGSDSAAWDLHTSVGTDQYVHNFCTSNCDASPTWTNLATSSYATLATGITTSTPDQVFDLQILVPSATGDTNEQSVDVTVQAVAN